jgi:hypothetical protein
MSKTFKDDKWKERKPKKKIKAGNKSRVDVVRASRREIDEINVYRET